MMGTNFLIVFSALVADVLRGENVLAVESLEDTAYVHTKFTELPNFYEELKLSQNSLNISSTVSNNTLYLCSLVFGSNSLILLDEYETTMQQYYPDIFDELFTKEEKVGIKRLLSRTRLFKTRYKYDDSSKPRIFIVNGNAYEENTFVCAVQNADTTPFQIFFVSDYGYNVNDAPGGEKIFGRFVFLGKQIYALAEQLPRATRTVTPKTRSEYIEKRNHYQSVDKSEEDPVCKLDSAKKVRLCTYVGTFTVGECADKVAAQEPCEKRTFSLEDRSYNDWMLTCKIRRSPTSVEEVFVTHTYENNEVFVFEKGDTKELRLRFKLHRVGIVVYKRKDQSAVDVE